MAKTKPEPTPPNLDTMIVNLEAELASLVKSHADDAMAKAHEGESTSPEVPPDASATSPTPGDAPPDASMGGAPPPPDASAGGPPPPDAGAPPAGDAGGEAPPTLDDIVSALAQLPPEQFAMYDQAVQQVKAQQGAGGGAPPPDASAGGAPPPPDASAGGPPPDAMKSEYLATLTKAEGLARSQSETISDLRGKLAKAESDTKELAGLVETYLKTPRPRQAIIAAEARAKVPAAEDVASLDKSEVNGRLRRAMRNKALPDKDRAAAEAFTQGRATLDSIKHLIVAAPSAA